MAQKYTKEMIENILKDNNLLLVGNFISVNKKIDCISLDGYKAHIDIRGLMYRGRKPEFFHKNNPYTIYNINNYISINKIQTKLISTKYINNSFKMQWECDCGEIFELGWNAFLQGKTYCDKCGHNKRYDEERKLFDINEIRNKFNKRGYRLESTEFINKTSKLNYICLKHKDKGVLSISYSEFEDGQGCIHCAHEVLGKSKRKSEIELQKLTESKGFIYYGYEYKNNTALLNICVLIMNLKACK
jgi:hypothetical protein